MLSVVAILWLTFAISGQGCLLVVLLTLAVVKSLPQRNNPFLINFILTTFLAQFPPTLLLFTGQLNDNPPKFLCLTQSVLMDGVAPMFGIALVILVFQTWSDLRATFLGRILITSKLPSLRAALLMAPYIAMVAWCIASLAAASQSPPVIGLTQIVYCANNSVPGTRVRRFVGFFMLVFGIIEFFIEACIGRLIYIHLSKTARRTCGKSYLVSYHFAIRVLVFCFLQTVPIILAALNSLLRLNSPAIKNTTHLLESMNAWVTFLVFGTSNDILQAWGLKRRQTAKASTEVLGSTQGKIVSGDANV